MGGRIGAIYGRKNAVAVAGIWWVVWTLISGFMKDVMSLSIMRALSGVGGAFVVPNAIALLTITFPPGRMRNISVGLFVAMAPIGTAGGSVFPGFFVQLLPWKWLFFPSCKKVVRSRLERAADNFQGNARSCCIRAVHLGSSK